MAAKAVVERRLFGGQSGSGAAASWRPKWSWDDGHLAAKAGLGRRPFGDQRGPGTFLGRTGSERISCAGGWAFTSHVSLGRGPFTSYVSLHFFRSRSERLFSYFRSLSRFPVHDLFNSGQIFPFTTYLIRRHFLHICVFSAAPREAENCRGIFMEIGARSAPRIFL